MEPTTAALLMRGKRSRIVAIGDAVVAVPFVLRSTTRQEVVDDEVGDPATQPASARQAEAKMNARKDATQRALVCRGRQALERAGDIRQHLRCHGQVESIALED